MYKLYLRMKKKLKKTQEIAQKKKQKLLHHGWIILAGLIIALWVHFYVIDDGDINSLKTSVRDISNTASQQEVSDLYFEQINDNYIALKTSQAINNITQLSFSITYNPEDLDIVNTSPVNSKTKILNISNIAWIQTTLLEWWKSENISAGNTLVEIQFEKLSSNTTPLNIIVDTVSFSDTNLDSYSPTTSWIQL